MAIRMKEWGMLAAPGQPVHVRTQGLFSWERVGRNMGEGLAHALKGAQALAALEQVDSAGELASFSEQLKSISAEVSAELQEEDVQDWDYAWQQAMAPRLHEAVQELSAGAREGGRELARVYSAQASIEAQRDRDLRRVSSARGRWEQQVEASISAGQEEQAARWLEAGRGVFVPEQHMPARLAAARSRARHAHWEARLQAAPLETLRDVEAASRHSRNSTLPAGKEERRALRQSCGRVRRALCRELAQQFSERLRAGEEPEPATLKLAAEAGVLPTEGLPGTPATPTDATRSAWRRWVDEREDGEECEQAARLALAAAPLPQEERRALLQHLERTARVPAADRRTLSQRLFSLYSSGAFGCPGDADAWRCLLSLQQEGSTLLAEQGAGAVSDWLEALCPAESPWVCFEGSAPGNQR